MNYIYIKSSDYRPGQNSVFGYRQNTDGTLTPLPDSPFLTMGTGVQDPKDIFGPVDEDQDLIASPDGRLLFVTNGGSNTVTVFKIRPNGKLKPVHGSPFPSGGRDPVSVGYAGGKLYVVNKNEDFTQLPNSDLPNYTGFRVKADGSLEPIPGTTVTTAALASPTQAQISPDGKLLFGADLGLFQYPPFVPPGTVTFDHPRVRSFHIAHDGTLGEASGSPLLIPDDGYPPPLSLLPPDAPRLPLGLAVHPVQPVIYSGVVSHNAVATLRFDEDSGALTYVGHVATMAGAPCWLAINRAGSRLYTIGTLNTAVTVLDTSNALHPTELQFVALRGTGDAGDVVNATLDSHDGYLYVLSQKNSVGFPHVDSINAVHILKVADNGGVTEVASSPYLLPAGDTYRAAGIVAVERVRHADDDQETD